MSGRGALCNGRRGDGDEQYENPEEEDDGIEKDEHEDEG